jgi:hypothetical protein
MSKVWIFKCIQVSLMLVISSFSYADQLFIDELNIEATTIEQNSLFNALPGKKITVSYNIYLRGEVRPDELLQFWSRIFNSIEEPNELSSALLVIREISDSTLCILNEDMEFQKYSSLSELCY